MSDDHFYDDERPRRVSVADVRTRAEACAKELSDQGETLEPAVSKGRKLATTFWGQAWNRNLERYAVYEHRLPSGRSYLSNGAVIDLKIQRGRISAQVVGSGLYAVNIRIRPMDEERWSELKTSCAGRIDSIVGLLQGKLPAPVMEAVVREEEGLFPEPSDIRFDCTCPDDADLCKHCAAAAYGVGVRLDEKPELLFLLRGVDPAELIVSASDSVAAKSDDVGASGLSGDLGEIFGIDLEG